MIKLIKGGAKGGTKGGIERGIGGGDETRGGTRWGVSGDVRGGVRGGGGVDEDARWVIVRRWRRNCRGIDGGIKGGFRRGIGGDARGGFRAGSDTWGGVRDEVDYGASEGFASDANDNGDGNIGGIGKAFGDGGSADGGSKEVFKGAGSMGGSFEHM